MPGAGTAEAFHVNSALLMAESVAEIVKVPVAVLPPQVNVP